MNTFFKLLKKLYEIEAQIIIFTNLPIDTPGLHLIAQDIINKFVFFRKFVTAEAVSHTSMPEGLSEIEGRITQLEDEFHRHVDAHVEDDDDDDDDDSELESVCESCLNYDREVEGDDEMLLCDYGVMGPLEECGGGWTVADQGDRRGGETAEMREKGGRRWRRWWWRTVVVLMLASVVWAVSYFDKKQREGFLTPT